MTHQHADTDHTELFTPEFWDARYLTAERIWSGNANPHLVTHASPLTPGSALDVGAGEGADAIWLAALGWRVTAVDISQVALDRGAAEADRRDPATAGRITWRQADLFTWAPEPVTYDLVSAQFVHLPEPQRVALHRRLAAAVRTGGTLLVVGHHPSDMVEGRGAHLQELMFTPEQVVAVLDPAGWDVETAVVAREIPDRDGTPVTHHDAVVRAVRR